MTTLHLHIGDKSPNGQVEIIDEDRLVYLVKSISRGAEGVRTISKALLVEFVDYYAENPNADSDQARDRLKGKSNIDRYEYGYNSTLANLAKMELSLPVERRSDIQTSLSESEPITVLYRFAHYVFKELSKVDELLALQPYLSEKSDWYWIENSKVKSGLFRKQLLQGQTSDEPIKYAGKDVYVASGWDKDDKLTCPSFGVLKYIVDSFYSKYFRIELRKKEQNKDAYVLIKLANKFNASATSSSLSKQSFPTYQSIFFGTPGSGKSYAVRTLLKDKLNIPDEFVFRTTFFPDYDYAQFVGCYKPTMRTSDEQDNSAGMASETSMPFNQSKNKKIEYAFVAQQFTKAYVKAWKNPDVPVFLVVEEINRGNCASIFGDLFQLLDRKDGVSEYSINADEDLKNHLVDKLGEDSDGIKGGKLTLPKNFNIIATMNTSDQSLFPMDSAFKRRWDWKYFAIRNEGKDFKIDIDGQKYDWWNFVEKINKRIYEATESEDKKIGYWFAKANADGEITCDVFVSKVLFYLWNDVFKDLENNPFGDTKFTDMYNSVGEFETLKVKEFIENLFREDSQESQNASATDNQDDNQ